MIMLKQLECPICLETLELPIVLICGHTFCRKCIQQQKQYSNTCPTCRSRISWGHPCYLLKSIIEKYSLSINNG